MLQIDVVAETAYDLSESEWWTRVVDTSPLIRLYEGMTETEVAAIVIAIAKHNRVSTDGGFVSISNALLKDDVLILSGGIRVRDEGKEIRPGCCCGVENWREQAEGFLGKEHWMGHDPAPWIETRNNNVFIWSDGGLGETKQGIFSIQIEKDQADRVFGVIQHDLRGFLGRLYHWAERNVGPVLASKLVATVDDHWTISDRKPLVVGTT